MTATERTKSDITHVLLVEDNRGYAYFVRDVLTRRGGGGYRLESTDNLEAAERLLAETDVDIVLLDLGLTDSSGYSTFERMHSAAPDVPIIILTVLEDDETVVRAMRGGAQDYLLKSRLEPDLLVAAIRHAIERNRAERAVRELSGRLLQSQDDERRRLARALHETTAQNLAALSMTLAMLKGACGPDLGGEAQVLLKRCLEQVEQCSSEVRTMSYLLHPPLLDELGLAGAVRDYADGFAQRSGLRVDLDMPENWPRLSPDAETTIFRVLQESLTNVHRHSGSRTASIQFECGTDRVCLRVRDTGRGLPSAEGADGMTEATPLGVGIPGMRERVRQLGGRFRVASSPRGTQVEAILPVSEDVLQEPRPPGGSAAAAPAGDGAA